MLVFKNGLCYLHRDGKVFACDTAAVPAPTFYAAKDVSEIVWQDVPRTW